MESLTEDTDIRVDDHVAVARAPADRASTATQAMNTSALSVPEGQQQTNEVLFVHDPPEMTTVNTTVVDSKLGLTITTIDGHTTRRRWPWRQPWTARRI